MAMSFKAITDRTHSFSMRCAKRKELGETISTDVTVALFALKLWMFCDYLMIFIHSFLFYFGGGDLYGEQGYFARSGQQMRFALQFLILGDLFAV